MANQSTHESAIPNPALKPFSFLVGEWKTTGSHRLMPDTTLHGHVSFRWLEAGAFLMMHSEVEEEGVPSAIAIFGSDDKTNAYFMLYFDERGVSRKFDVKISANVLYYERLVAGFSQRFTGNLSTDGNTIVSVTELNEDNVTWQRDLEMTFTRIK